MDKAVLEPHVPAPGFFCQNRVDGISDRRHNHERSITYAQVGQILNFGIAAKDRFATKRCTDRLNVRFSPKADIGSARRRV